MTDSWERRAVAHVPGYYTPKPNVPAITVTYDQALNKLNIVANMPLFDELNKIVWSGTAGSGESFAIAALDSTHAEVNDVRELMGSGSVLSQIDLYDMDDVDFVTWTGSLELTAAAPGAPDITSADTPSGGTLHIVGTNLDLTARLRVFDDLAFDKVYAITVGSNAPEVTITYGADQITIQDPALDGLTITDIQARIDPGNSVADEWFGSVGPIAASPTFPLLESICSPAANTIRLVGQRFITATAGTVGYVTVRLADYTTDPAFSGSTLQYEFADGSPDSHGWELVNFSDTEIEIRNTGFSTYEPSAGPGDFVVTGAAFHNDDTLGYYYYEPWGETFSTPVDGAGCP